jgi:uncharacterized protein
LIEKGMKITAAIQVATSLNASETKQRELDGLIEAMELYGLNQGYILTENTESVENIKHQNKNYKIHIVPIWKWLLGV